MTGVQTFEARAALGTVAAIATVAAYHWQAAYRASPQRFNRAYLAVFAAARLLLFSVVFLLLRLPVRGDLPSFYMQEAWRRLEGKVPYRDFLSSYAPLSTYVYAAVYRLHRSPVTLVFFAVVVEIAAAALWLAVLERVAPRRVGRAAALLCLFNPISLQYVTIDGQNNVLISFFLALAFLALLRGRAALSGAWVGAAIAVVKFLPLLFLPSFVLYARRRGVAWAAACGAVILAVYGYFQWVLHAPVLSVFTREGDLKTAGGLPYLVEGSSGLDLGFALWDRLLLAVLAALVCRVALLAWRGRSMVLVAEVRATMSSISVFLLVLMGLAKKTWPTYSLMVLFPLGLAVGATATGRRGWWQRSAVVLFAVFSLLSVTVHSFWASVLQQAPAMLLHPLLRAGVVTAWSLLALEFALFGSYAWLVVLCLRQESADAQEAPFSLEDGAISVDSTP